VGVCRDTQCGGWRDVVSCVANGLRYHNLHNEFITWEAETMWYTLVRFKDAPQHITGVSQAKTAGDALLLMESWEQGFPGETTVVFDPKNAPVNRKALSDSATRIANANESWVRAR